MTAKARVGTRARTCGRMPGSLRPCRLLALGLTGMMAAGHMVISAIIVGL